MSQLSGHTMRGFPGSSADIQTAPYRAKERGARTIAEVAHPKTGPDGLWWVGLSGPYKTHAAAERARARYIEKRGLR